MHHKWAPSVVQGLEGEARDYYLSLKLINQDLVATVFEEYLIYDFIGMIGSVGGTLGIYMFIFIISNVIIIPHGIVNF